MENKKDTILKFKFIEFNVTKMCDHADAISNTIKARMDARLAEVRRLNEENAERVRREFLGQEK